MRYKKDYSIEWIEECEADSFKEAEEALDKLAELTIFSNCLDIFKGFEVEVITDENDM